MYLFLATWLFQACTKSETTPDDKAQQVIDKAIEVHGGKSKYANLEMNYVFRDKSYYPSKVQMESTSIGVRSRKRGNL
mgnify:CR=1 FL=1